MTHSPPAFASRTRAALWTLAALLALVPGGLAAEWGGFAAPVRVEMGGPPWDHRLVDLNDDGLPDLICPLRTRGTFAYRLNETTSPGGPVQFGPPQTFPAGAREAYDLDVADFNSDGIWDVVISNSGLSGAVTISMGKGEGGTWDGTFDSPFVLEELGGYNQVLAVDFNQDGITDILITRNGFYNGVVVYLGNGSDGKGDGTFRSVSEKPGGTSPGLAAVDVNRDNILDVAIPGDAFAEEGWFLFLGAGENGEATGELSDIRWASGPLGMSTEIVFGDFNEDGWPDAACGYIRVNNSDPEPGVRVYMNQTEEPGGAPVFAEGVLYPTTTAEGADSIAAHDVDGDGHLDLLATTFRDLSLAFFRGRGDGTFEPPIIFPSLGATHVEMADMNNDGIIDAVTGPISILLGREATGDVWMIGGAEP